MLANILANEIDFTLGRNLSFEQSQTVRAQWRDGTVRLGSSSNPLITYPGFLYADPAIVRDLRFRRAWLQAINRQELAETLLPGFSSVAHSFLLPSDPDYAALEPSMVKYAYDPQSSIRTLGELGYTRGGDGMFRDAAGQTLTIELRTTSDNEIHVTALYPTVDYLKAVGVQVTPEVIPPARQRDVEYRAKIPGFQQTQGSGSLSSLANFQSSQQKTAENGWRGQHTGYGNPEFDAMVDRYFTTIPKTERLRAAGQAINHMTDQLVIMTSFYVSATQIVANRLRNVPTNGSAANIQEWETSQ
jgi:peptide/nickel transport system substrate-binding protein